MYKRQCQSDRHHRAHAEAGDQGTGDKTRRVHADDVPLNAEGCLADGVVAHDHGQRRRRHLHVHHRIAGEAADQDVYKRQISNSVTSSTGIGIYADNQSSPSTITVSIENLTATDNFEGVTAWGTSNVQLSRSVITGNTYGITNNTQPNTFYTYNDNQIGQNSLADITGITPTLNTLNKQ